VTFWKRGATLFGRRRRDSSSPREAHASKDDSVPFEIARSLQDFLDARETGDTPLGERHDNIRVYASRGLGLRLARSDLAHRFVKLSHRGGAFFGEQSPFLESGVIDHEPHQPA
jgi:hypothetical protein